MTGVSKGHGAHIILETGADPIVKGLERAAYINFINYTSGKNTITVDQHNVNLFPLSETPTHYTGHYQQAYWLLKSHL